MKPLLFLRAVFIGSAVISFSLLDVLAEEEFDLQDHLDNWSADWSNRVFDKDIYGSFESDESESDEERCINAADYKGCMEYHSGPSTESG